MFMVMSFVLSLIVFIVFWLMYMKNKMDMEGVSSYECGFDLLSLTRMSFSYRFYLISILFIIFDVEVSLMLPIPFVFSFDMSLFCFLLFMFILIIGLIYEYYCGSLDWLGIMIKS